MSKLKFYFVPSAIYKVVPVTILVIVVILWIWNTLVDNANQERIGLGLFGEPAYRKITPEKDFMDVHPLLFISLIVLVVVLGIYFYLTSINSFRHKKRTR